MTNEQTKLIESLVEEKVRSIAESFERNAVHLANSVALELQANRRLAAENRSLKADLLTQLSQSENERLNATGRGVMTGSVQLTAEEKAVLLPARINLMSLEECVLHDAIGKGVNPKNEKEFSSYLGVEGEE